MQVPQAPQAHPERTVMMVPQVPLAARAPQVCYTASGCSLLVGSYLLQQTVPTQPAWQLPVGTWLGMWCVAEYACNVSYGAAET